MWVGGKGKRIALQIQTCIEYQGRVVDDTEKSRREVMSLASCVVQIHTPTISALAVVRKMIPSSRVAWFRCRFQW